MDMQRIKYLFSAATIFLTVSCQSGQAEYKYPQKIKGKYEMLTQEEAEQKNDTLFDKKYLTFNINKPQEETKNAETIQHIEKEDKNEKSVSDKQPLWVNVLPVLSHYPIDDIYQDSLITTEWFSDTENPSKQLKINAVKAGESVRITVLCRQKDKNGEWVNQKNDEALADKIKNDIVKQSLNNN